MAVGPGKRIARVDSEWMGGVDEHLRTLDRRLDGIERWQGAHDDQEMEQFTVVQKHMALTNTKLDTLTKLEERLIGNGTDGLVVRVDRLEQYKKTAESAKSRRGKMAVAIWVGVVLLGIELILTKILPLISG